MDTSPEPSFLSLTREGSILREREDSQPMKDQDIQVELEEPPGHERLPYSWEDDPSFILHAWANVPVGRE
jgi:hypothetical protein